jgi:MFS family permease
MPVYGYLGSRNPLLKRPLLIGSLLVGVLVLASISFANSMMLVIVVNFFYGVVSASIFVVAFSIIRDMYDARQAGVYLGFIGTVTSIGMFAGPTLIGLTIDFLGWRIAYVFCWLLLLAAVVLIFLGVKVKKDYISPPSKGANTLDLLGAFALTLFLAGVILCLSFGKSALPFGSLANNLLIALSAVSLCVLIIDILKKRNKAFIPLTVFQDRNTVVLTLNNLFVNFSTIALTFFLPSYIINVLHGSALQAGLSTAIYAVLGIFICPFLGRRIAKAGTARGLITAGTIVRIIITVAFIAFLVPNSPLLELFPATQDTLIWVIYVLILFAGFYSAQHNVTSSTAPQIQIKQEIRFQSNSVVQTAQNLGSSIGMAVYTAVMASYGIVDGMPVALILAVIAAVVVLIVGQFLKKAPSSSD